MPADLLFEIGCEEIPAEVAGARARRAAGAVAGARWPRRGSRTARVRALGTPRRLAVIVKRARRSPARSRASEVVGPPVGAAFDADGAPTKAAHRLRRRRTASTPASLEKSEVAGQEGPVRRRARATCRAGRRARLLPALLARARSAAIPWPKSMRWGWGETAFVRPVQWLVALLGGEVVPLTFAGVDAPAAPRRGHRFLAPGPIELDGAAAGYVDALRAAHVVVDPDARRDDDRAPSWRASRRETGARGPARRRRCSTRSPTWSSTRSAVCGEFDPRVPRGARGGHRHRDAHPPALLRDGGRRRQAAPTGSSTIAGTIVKRRRPWSAHGNERVLAARLADAQFFFPEDRKKPLDELARASSTASCSRPSSATRRRRQGRAGSQRSPAAHRRGGRRRPRSPARGRRAVQGRPRDRAWSASSPSCRA